MGQQILVQTDKEFWRATVPWKWPAGFGKGPLKKGCHQAVPRWRPTSCRMPGC